MTQATTQFQSFVGVDLHKATVSLSAVDGGGQIIARLKTSTKCVQRIDTFLAELPRPVHLAVEACPFVEWFIDRYRPQLQASGGGGRIDIADATQLAALRGKRRKTDRKDADDIAIRLARGDCPLGWIADEAISELRKLGRQWHRLARTLSRTKHSMRGILLQQNLPGPGKIEGDSAQRWLLAHGHLLKEVDRRGFGDLLAIVQTIERLQAPLKIRIIQACGDERFAALIELLKTVPGIRHITACIIAAEVGDFARFPNADALEFWAGLTPDLKESARRLASGGITKAGSRTLRWALGVSAMALCQSDAVQEAHRQRIIQRCGRVRAKANVAMARRLLRIVYAMVRDGAAYEVGQPTARNAQANRARLVHKQRSTASANAA